MYVEIKEAPTWPRANGGVDDAEGGDHRYATAGSPLHLGDHPGGSGRPRARPDLARGSPTARINDAAS